MLYSSGGGVALDTSKSGITDSNSDPGKMLACGVYAVLVMALMPLLQLARQVSLSMCCPAASKLKA